MESMAIANHFFDSWREMAIFAFMCLRQSNKGVCSVRAPFSLIVANFLVNISKVKFHGLNQKSPK